MYMNNIKLNGLSDDINCSTINIVETVNGIDADLLQELYGLRDNIQNQIDNISAGITTDTNLNINSLTTADYVHTQNITTNTLTSNSITLNGGMTCTGITANNNISAYNFIQRGSTLDSLLSNKQNLITGVVDISPRNIVCNSITQNGSTLNSLLSAKQNNITSTTDITCQSLTAPNISLGSSSLQTLLNNKLNNIAIGTVTTLTAGSSATATVTTADNISTINLGIPTGLSGANGFNGGKGDTGDKGDRGDKGDKGDSGDSADIAGIIATILTSGTILGALAAIAVLEGQIVTMQGQITAIDIEIASLQAKTLYQSIVGTATRFTSNLQINDGMFNDVILKTGDKSEFFQGISSHSDVTVNGLISATGPISTDDNISSSGDLIINGSTTLGSSIISNSHTITGNTLDVNCAFINLNGFVSGSFFTSNYFNQLGF